MKKIIAIILFSQTALAAPPSRSVDHAISNSLSVGTTAVANSKSVVDMVSTTKGMLPPRMTSTQRDAIATPPTGLVIYNTTTAKLNQYNGTAWVDVGSGGSSGGGSGINLLTNYNFDFEQGASNWTASGGSFTQASSGGNLLIGLKSGVFNASATSQTLTSAAIPVTTSDAPGIAGGNGYASCFFKTTATDYKLQVYDGTTVLSERTIPVLTSAQEIGLYFIVPTSGSIYLRAISASDAADLALDNCFMGSANVISVSQASFYGSLITAGTTNCSWAITQTTYAADFSADTDCPTPSVTGSVTAPGTKVPQIVLNNAPAATYEVSVESGFATSGSGSNSACRLVDDAGTELVSTPIRTVASNQGTKTIIGQVTYTSPGNRTIKLQCLADSGDVATVTNIANFNMTWLVKKFPVAQEQAIRADQIIQSWTGYHDNTCAWSRTNTAYGDPAADATCNLVTRQSTNLTVTSALSGSDKLPGIVINSSLARKFKVCANPKLSPGTANNFVHARLTDGTTTIAEWQWFGTTNNQVNSLQNCGVYSAVVGANTLKIQLASSAGAAQITHNAEAQPLAAIEWLVEADDTPQAAPLINNSITTNSSGLHRMEWAAINGTTITAQSGSWVSSVSNPSTGNYTLTLSGSAFSSTPGCTCGGGESDAVVSGCFATSSTSVTVETRSAGGGALAARKFQIHCMGPR